MRETRACPICGGSSFTFGKVRETNGGGAIWFEPDDRTFFDKITFQGKSDVVVRACLDCKNLQLFASELDLIADAPITGVGDSP